MRSADPPADARKAGIARCYALWTPIPIGTVVWDQTLGSSKLMFSYKREQSPFVEGLPPKVMRSMGLFGGCRESKGFLQSIMFAEM